MSSRSKPSGAFYRKRAAKCEEEGKAQIGLLHKFMKLNPSDNVGKPDDPQLTLIKQEEEKAASMKVEGDKSQQQQQAEVKDNSECDDNDIEDDNTEFEAAVVNSISIYNDIGVLKRPIEDCEFATCWTWNHSTFKQKWAFCRRDWMIKEQVDL